MLIVGDSNLESHNQQDTHDVFKNLFLWNRIDALYLKFNAIPEHFASSSISSISNGVDKPFTVWKFEFVMIWLCYHHIPPTTRAQEFILSWSDTHSRLSTFKSWWAFEGIILWRILYVRHGGPTATDWPSMKLSNPFPGASSWLLFCLKFFESLDLLMIDLLWSKLYKLIKTWTAHQPVHIFRIIFEHFSSLE